MATQTDNSKYGDILNTGRELFWKHGIRRVSVEEICLEAGVSKMTFYRFFPNKVELAKTILQQQFDKSMVEYRTLMDSDISFEEKVRQQLLLKFQGTKEISAELVKDIYSNQAWGLSEYMEQRTNEALVIFMHDYTQAQNKGFLRKDVKLEFLLYFLNQMAAWVSDERLLAHYDHAQDLIMEIANFFFYGILPHEKRTDG